MLSALFSPSVSEPTKLNGCRSLWRKVTPIRGPMSLSALRTRSLVAVRSASSSCARTILALVASRAMTIRPAPNDRWNNRLERVTMPPWEMSEKRLIVFLASDWSGPGSGWFRAFHMMCLPPAAGEVSLRHRTRYQQFGHFNSPLDQVLRCLAGDSELSRTTRTFFSMSSADQPRLCAMTGNWGNWKPISRRTSASGPPPPARCPARR